MAAKYIILGATFNGDGTTLSEAVGSTVTITIATPGVVTWTGHTFAANAVVYLATTGALPTGLTAGARYFVRNPLTNTFELSLTSGGASIATSGTQSGVHTGSGVGAWNQQSIITNTAPAFGTLAAGDTVNIRSKTSGGADLLITFAASINVGKSGLAYGQRVNWVLDDGTIWAGINGTLTFQSAGFGAAPAFQVHNTFEARVKNAIMVKYGPYASSAVVAGGGEGLVFRYVRFDSTQAQAGANSGIAVGSFSGEVIFDQCSFIFGYRSVSGYLSSAQYSLCTLIAPDIEVTLPTQTGPIFVPGVYGSQIRVLGGRIYGAGIYAGLALSAPGSPNGGGLELIGTQYDKSLVPFSTTPITSSPTVRAMTLGADSAMGSVIKDWAVTADSRDYINLPRLNASTPGAAPVPWAVQVKPDVNVSSSRIAKLAPIAKMYEAAAAVVTLRFELLVESTFATIDASTAYLYVIYTDDTTGNQVCLTSRGTGALAASTAAWSATTYGAESFTKQKIEVVTTSTVRQYTPIFVQLCVEAPASIASKYLIVCPDVQIV